MLSNVFTRVKQLDNKTGIWRHNTTNVVISFAQMDGFAMGQFSRKLCRLTSSSRRQRCPKAEPSVQKNFTSQQTDTAFTSSHPSGVFFQNYSPHFFQKRTYFFFHIPFSHKHSMSIHKIHPVFTTGAPVPWPFDPGSVPQVIPWNARGRRPRAAVGVVPCGDKRWMFG